jgi:GDP-L-fucose synthase
MAQRILLTGGSGMVGSNIIENANSTSFELIAPTSSEMNLMDENSVKNAFLKYKPDTVVHSAGLVGGIQANIANPVEFMVKNVDIAKNIILTSQEFGVERFLNIASSCMYPRDASNPLKPEMILKGELEPTNEGYALAKIYSTRLCGYMSMQYGLNYKTIIPCNLYGRFDKFGEHNSHLIPAIIKKIYDAKAKGSRKIEVWGSGNVRREFLYAADLANFIFYSLTNYEKIEPIINVGYGKDYTINEYYTRVSEVLNWPIEMMHDLAKPEGMKQKFVCNENALKKGWRPKTNLSEGISQTIDYYIERVRDVY